jgi:hypothetical protein
MTNKIYISLIIIIVIVLVINCIKFKQIIKEGLTNKHKFKTDKSGKLILFDKCKFKGKGFSKKHELGECSIAIQVVPLVKNVIEIGGGTGKVSHIINTMLADNTQHIVVEPGVGGNGHHGDFNIYNNKAHFKDKYTIIKKFAENLTHNDFSVLKNKPDCLYVDCEGCLHKFQNTEIGKYVINNARYIVNEMDGNNKLIIKQWKKHGFVKIGTGYGCGINCSTDIWYKER